MVVVEETVVEVVGTVVLVDSTVVDVVATVVEVVSTVVEVVATVVLVLSTVVEVVASVVLVEVVLGTVVLLTAHGSGSHVPAPWLVPLRALHSSGDRSSQVNAPIGLSNAPLTDDGTQHWIAGQSVQQLVPVPTVPPWRSHDSADLAMPQRSPLVQVTAPSNPQVERTAQRKMAKRQRRGTSSSPFTTRATHFR